MSYCNLKDIGNVYQTATFSPFCLPGMNFGRSFITRTASLSQSENNERITSTLSTCPVFETTKRTITLPCILFC